MYASKRLRENKVCINAYQTNVLNPSHHCHSKGKTAMRSFIGSNLLIMVGGIKTYQKLERWKPVPGFSTMMLFSFGDPVTLEVSGFTAFVSARKQISISIRYTYLIATPAGSGKTILS